MNMILNIVGAALIIYITGIIAVLTVFRKKSMRIITKACRDLAKRGDQSHVLPLEALENQIGTDRFIALMTAMISLAWLPMMVIIVKSKIEKRLTH